MPEKDPTTWSAATSLAIQIILWLITGNVWIGAADYP
jgi:hypothetical protein